jgi:hypothetical protein
MESQTSSKISEQETITRLQQELKDIKIWCGFEADSSLDDMKNQEDLLKEQELQLRNEDEEHKIAAEANDKLINLVIRSHDVQYSIEEIQQKINELGIDEDKTRKIRRDFCNAFVYLKESIKKDDLGTFFELVNEWISAKEELTNIDIKIQGLSS